MKINALFPCGPPARTRSPRCRCCWRRTQDQEQVHHLYKVIRGDFSNGDADSDEKVLKSVAVRLAPEMRDLQAAAARELSTGSMTIALVLSYVDLGSTVAVGVSYLAIGDGKHRADAIVTFAIIGGNLALQGLSAWSTARG